MSSRSFKNFEMYFALRASSVNKIFMQDALKQSACSPKSCKPTWCILFYVVTCDYCARNAEIIPFVVRVHQRAFRYLIYPNTHRYLPQHGVVGVRTGKVHFKFRHFTVVFELLLCKQFKDEQPLCNKSWQDCLISEVLGWYGSQKQYQKTYLLRHISFLLRFHPYLRCEEPYVRESKTVFDSAFQVLNSGFFVSGSWIPTFSVIPGSLSSIPGSVAQMLDSISKKISQILDFKS